MPPPAGGIYVGGMCLPEEEVSEFHPPLLVGEGWGEGEGQTHAAANHQKFAAVVAGTSRTPTASISDPAKIERARGFEMTAQVLDFSKQLSPDKLVCKEDQDATLAILDHLPIGDFEILTPPSLLKGHLARLQGLNKIATLTLPEDLEVKQAGLGIGIAVVALISLIIEACSSDDKADVIHSDTSDTGYTPPIIEDVKPETIPAKTEFTVGCNGDFISIQQAVDSVPSGTILNLCAAKFEEVVVIKNKNLKIIGDPAGTILLGDGINGIVKIAGSKVNFKNVNFTGGRDDFGNVEISESSDVTFTDAIFSGNESKKGCGALSVNDSTVTISNGSFNDNKTKSSGGAICLSKAKLTTANVTFTNNQTMQFGSASYGGAIFSSNSTISLAHTSFNGNSAGAGGALFLTKTKVSLSDVKFVGNDAVNASAAWVTDDSQLFVDLGYGDTVFEDNGKTDLVVFHNSSFSVTPGNGNRRLYFKELNTPPSNIPDDTKYKYMSVYNNGYAYLRDVIFCNPSSDDYHIDVHTTPKSASYATSILNVADSRSEDCIGNAIPDQMVISTDSAVYKYAEITDGCNVICTPEGCQDGGCTSDENCETPYDDNYNGWANENCGTYYVGCDNEYDNGTINAAIQATQKGAEIVICEGTYNEPVEITKNVTLVGQGKVVIKGNGSCEQVKVGEGVSNFGFKDITFSNARLYLDYADAGKAFDVTFENCDFVQYDESYDNCEGSAAIAYIGNAPQTYGTGNTIFVGGLVYGNKCGEVPCLRFHSNHLTIDDTEFKYNKTKDYGIVNISTTDNFQLDHISFLDNKNNNDSDYDGYSNTAVLPACIKLMFATGSITNSSFTNCHGRAAGAIAIDTSTLTLKDDVFNGNMALSDELGLSGAIVLRQAIPELPSVLNVQNASSWYKNNIPQGIGFFYDKQGPGQQFLDWGYSVPIPNKSSFTCKTASGKCQ